MADEFGLSLRQRRFVDLYLVCGNATQAYIQAGYSPKNAGPDAGKIINNPKVSKAIAELTPKPAKSVEDLVTPQQVIEGLIAETRGDNAPTRVQAWRELGRALGMFLDRSESKVTTSFADEIESLQDKIREAKRNAPSLRVVKPLE